jgi:hypothetical protein
MLEDLLIEFGIKLDNKNIVEAVFNISSFFHINLVGVWVFKPIKSLGYPNLPYRPTLS